VMDLLPTLAEAAGIAAGNVKQLDGKDRWDAVIGKGANRREEPLYFTSNSPVYNSFMHGVLDGKWKLVQTIDHQRRSTTVESMLFDIYADPGEKTDLADKYPNQVERLTELLDARLDKHPVGGVYVQVMPHPGWRAPKDYAEAVIPADKVNYEPHQGFGAVASKILQSLYDGRGKITYD